MGRSLDNSISSSSSSTSIALNDTPGGNLLEVTSKENFTKNDLVFLDYKRGIITNNNSGKQFSTVPDVVAAVIISTSYAPLSCSIDTPTGIVSIVALNEANVNSIAVYFSDKNGDKVYSGNLEQNADYQVNSITMTSLSNGNIGCVWGRAQGAVKWIILSPTGEILFSSIGVYGLSGTNSYIRETNNGGFVFTTTGNGFLFVNSTGIQTNLLVATGLSLDIGSLSNRIDLTDDCSKRLNTRQPCTYTSVNKSTIDFADGSFAFIYGNGANGRYFTKFNPNGTLNTHTQIATGAALNNSSYELYVTVAKTNENICYYACGQGSTGFYGVIDSSGNTIKSPTVIYSFSYYGGTATLKLVSDSSGNFVIIGTDGVSGAYWNILYLTNVGVPIASYPKKLVDSDYTGSSISPNLNKVVSLSTGIVCLLSYDTSRFNYFTITNAGSTIVKTDSGYSLSETYSKVMSLSVINDTIYGCYTCAPQITSNPIIALFSFNISGERHLTITNTTSYGNSISTECYTVIDPASNMLYFLNSNQVLSFDLNTRLLNSTYTLPGTLDSGYYGNVRVRVKNSGLIIDSASAVPILLFSPKTTILLGVATSTNTPNQPFIIQTKGVMPVNYSGGFKIFDQTLNTTIPPGNKGWIAGNVISLKGLQA